MSSPRVSVVIPTYNRAGTVHAAVRSVLDQTFTDLEVIVVDDSSTDGTRAVLETIDDPRLRVVANPGQRGQSRAENAGIRLARAPWIAFQDSDDLWRQGKLAAQMSKLEEGGFIAVYCAMAVRDGGLGQGTDAPLIRTVPGPHVVPKEGNLLPALRYRSFASTQTLIISAEALQEVGGWDEDFSALNDWELMFRVARLGPIGFVPEVYVDQFISVDSVSRSHRARLEAYYKILARHGDEVGKDKEALAFHHYQIAGAHRRLAEYSASASHAWRAAKIRPTARRLGVAVYASLLSTFG